MDARKLSVGLGWFSIGLGVYEILGAGDLTRRIGLSGREDLIRSYGLREVLAGVSIFFAQPNPKLWVWTRVGGDALDIATLAGVLGPANSQRTGAGIALGAVLGVTVLDILCGRGLSA